MANLVTLSLSPSGMTSPQSGDVINAEAAPSGKVIALHSGADLLSRIRGVASPRKPPAPSSVHAVCCSRIASLKAQIESMAAVTATRHVLQVSGHVVGLVAIGEGHA